HGLATRSLPELSAGFKVSLNLHAEDEVSWEPRVQLTLACGDLLVSEPISPNSLLVPGQHFIQITNPDEAYETCRLIIEDPSRFEYIRSTGYQQVHTHLASAKAFPDFFTNLLNGFYRRPTWEPFRIRLGPLEVCKKYPGFEHLLEGLADFHA